MRHFVRPRIAALVVIATALLVTGCANSSGSTGSAAPGSARIVLSNSFVGNAWRQTMVSDVEKQASAAKSKGLIKSFDVVNSNNDVAQQISQLQSLILSKPSVILLLAASPTALNGVIQQACDAGIKVVAFDASVTAPCAYKLKPDWVKFGEQTMESVAKQMNYKGNVVLVRGVSGSDVDLGMYQGWMNVLKKYPAMKKVGEVNGNWDDATTQNAVRGLLSTAPEVDGVMAYVSGYGVAQAFLAANRKMPVIYGSNQGTFLKWWAEQKKSTNYTTESSMEGPAISEAAFWLAVNLANGKDFSRNLDYPTFTITNDEVDKYAAETPRDGFADQHWDNASTLKQWPAK
jgi:ribose transport system substrate-binding protein